MSEIKPCPFCGGKAVTSTFFDWDDFEYMPIEVNDSDVEVTCENERCINGWYLSPKAWNTRPIEDALNARIAELEAAQRWIPVGEKPLEAGTFFVLLKNGEVTKDFTFIDGGRYYWWNHGANITHYMPLPKLPEVQE